MSVRDHIAGLKRGAAAGTASRNARSTQTRELRIGRMLEARREIRQETNSYIEGQISSSTPEVSLQQALSMFVGASSNPARGVEMLQSLLVQNHNILPTLSSIPNLPAILAELSNHPEPSVRVANAHCAILSLQNDVTGIETKRLCISHLVSVIGTNPVLSERALWEIGTLSGDAQMIRDAAFHSGVLVSIGNLVDESLKSSPTPSQTPCAGEGSIASTISPAGSVIGLAAWTLAALCATPPPSEYLGVLTRLLIKLLVIRHREAALNTCWAIAQLATSIPAEAQQSLTPFCDLDLLSRLLGLCSLQDQRLVFAAIRAIAGLVAHSPVASQRVVSVGVVGVLKKLIGGGECGVGCHTEVIEGGNDVSRCGEGNSGHGRVVADACWIIGRLCCSATIGRQCVTLIPLLIKLLSSPSRDVWHEAVYAVSRITAIHDCALDSVLIEAGAVDGLSAVLSRLVGTPDTSTALGALEALGCLLACAADGDEAAGVDHSSLLSSLHLLQQGRDADVALKSGDLLSQYFPHDDYDGDEDIV